jgi:hypothetical protein
MTKTQNHAAESILAIDFGSTWTRALLFDIVEGQYYFIASGTAPSTIGVPHFDISESTHQALEHLEKVTGRNLLAPEGHLQTPSTEQGYGVDRLVMTISAGKYLNMVVTGLLSDVSLGSVSRLAASTYGTVVECIGLNDTRQLEEQLDAVLAGRPHLILISGGAEDGASRSVLKQVDLIVLVCRLLPQGERPVVLFTGNSALVPKVQERLSKWTNVYIAPNVRPAIDHEDLFPAQTDLAELVGLIRAHQIGGIREIGDISLSPLMPTAFAFGRMMRYFSRIYDPEKKVLGVDIGSRSTTIAASKAGSLALNVFPYGVGGGIMDVLAKQSVQEVVRWLAEDIRLDVVKDYLWQKSLFPDSVPMTHEALLIEQALARLILQIAMRQAADRYSDLGESFEPILASGSVLANAPNPAQSLQIILDGVQPLGVTTIALDMSGIITALGAIASENTVLPAQIVETGAFLNLGTVISPVCAARNGTPILRGRLEIEDCESQQIEVKQGTLAVLPLRPGQTGRLYLEPLRRLQIEAGRKRGAKSYKVVGGECGVIIDARGRPLELPTDDSLRRDLLSSWARAFEKA